MQEKYEITIAEIKEAMERGYSVMVVINGEYYEVKGE